jgi:hypothetical protein
MRSYENLDDNVKQVIDKINAAAEAVNKLRVEVDPGHVPFIKYLGVVVRNLRAIANDVADSCNEESGV